MIFKAVIYPVLFCFCMIIISYAEQKRRNISNNIWICLSLVYSIIVLSITLISREKESNTGLVLIPLKTYFDMFFGAGGFLDCTLQLIRHQKHADIHMHMAWTGFSYMVLNVELFMPIGYILAKMGKGWRRVVLCTFLFSFSIETAQIIFKLGWFDIDDIINNVLGALVGFRLSHRIDKLLKQKLTGNEDQQ